MGGRGSDISVLCISIHARPTSEHALTYPRCGSVRDDGRATKKAEASVERPHTPSSRLATAASRSRGCCCRRRCRLLLLRLRVDVAIVVIRCRVGPR